MTRNQGTLCCIAVLFASPYKKRQERQWALCDKLLVTFVLCTEPWNICDCIKLRCYAQWWGIAACSCHNFTHQLACHIVFGARRAQGPWGNAGSPSSLLAEWYLAQMLQGGCIAAWLSYAGLFCPLSLGASLPCHVVGTISTRDLSVCSAPARLTPTGPGQRPWRRRYGWQWLSQSTLQ